MGYCAEILKPLLAWIMGILSGFKSNNNLHLSVWVGVFSDWRNMNENMGVMSALWGN